MGKKIIIVILSVLAFHAQALDVNNTAGTLSSRVKDKNITTLNVSGTMNAEDFYFIADQLHQLSVVDLSDVTVVAGRTVALHYGSQNFAEGELPIGAFGSMKLTGVKLPSSLRVIGTAAFAGCTRLSSVQLPASLDSIGDYAFAGCASLASVTLPASVRAVGVGAFMRCTSLATFAVEPSSRLTRLGEAALMDCPVLRQVSLGSALQAMGERAMAGTGVSSLDLTASKAMTQVGDWAMVLTPLHDIKFPSSLTTMGEGVFMYDNNLAQIDLGGHVADVPAYLLAGTGLTGELDLDGLRTLGEYALYNVSALSSALLPATTTRLGYRSMAGMTGLQTLNSDAVEVPALGKRVWQGVNQGTVLLTVPNEALAQYQAAEQWKEFLFDAGWLRGDVNGDGEVNVADINMIVSILLGAVYDDQTMKRADVNEDGEVNISDVNAVVSIIMTGKPSAPAGVDVSDQIHLDDLPISPGEQRTLTLKLDNASHYSALQCDITLPQGLTLVTGQCGKGHELELQPIDDATSRVVLFSKGKQRLGDESLGAFTITVQADDDLLDESEILLSNVVLADDNNAAWHAADCVGRVRGSSGVDDLAFHSDRMWGSGRTLYIDAHAAATGQIVSMSGMQRDITVNVGVNRYEMEPGVYVIVLGGKSHKLVIK